MTEPKPHTDAQKGGCRTRDTRGAWAGDNASERSSNRACRLPTQGQELEGFPDETPATVANTSEQAPGMLRVATGVNRRLQRFKTASCPAPTPPL